MPIGKSYVPRVAKTAESGNAMGETIRDPWRRHEMFNGVDRAYGCRSFQGGKLIHLAPEANRIAQLAFCNFAQPCVPFAEHKGLPLGIEAFMIARENRCTDSLPLKIETARLNREMRADGEANEVDGVSHRPGFIEIVDAPNKPAFDIAPGAKVFYMEIADREHFGSLRQIGTDLRPELCPAIVSGAKKRKQLRLHPFMLEAKIFFFQAGAQSQPFFKAARGFHYVHG